VLCAAVRYTACSLVRALALSGHIEMRAQAEVPSARRPKTPTRILEHHVSRCSYLAGARMLRRLHDELAGKQIEMRVVAAHSDVRDRLRFEKLEDWVGPINRYVSLHEAVELPSRDDVSR
jgi:hypothetical protein